MIGELRRWSRSHGTGTSQRSRSGAVAGIFVSLCLLAITGCASTSLPIIPPVTPESTGLMKPGKFVWVDLITQDVAGAKTFYAALFGWTFVESGRYSTVLREGTPIAGIMAAADAEEGSEWISNLSVADVEGAAALVKERGGSVEHEPVDAPDRGRIAFVSDSEGAVVLLVRSSSGDPADGDPVLGDWLWQELWTHDIAGALDLYAALGGTEADSVEFRDAKYHVLRDGETLRAGVVDAPPEINPIWLPYVRVSDAAAAAKRAETLGARIVMQDERTAIMVDPTGAAIGIGTSDGDSDQGVEGAQ